MRRILASILTVLLLAALASCSAKNSDGAAAETEGTARTETKIQKTEQKAETSKPQDGSESAAAGQSAQPEAGASDGRVTSEDTGTEGKTTASDEADTPAEETKPEAEASPADRQEKAPETQEEFSISDTEIGNTVIIGVILQSDGESDQSLLDGVRLAMDQASRTGAEDRNFMLRTYYVDELKSDNGAENKIYEAYNQLIKAADKDGVAALILPELPDEAIQAAEQSAVPVMTIGGGSGNMYSVLSTEEELGADIADFVFDMLGMPKTAVIFDPEHESLSAAFEKHGTERGLVINLESLSPEGEMLQQTFDAATDEETGVLLAACREDVSAGIIEYAMQTHSQCRIILLGRPENEAVLSAENVICVANYSPDDTSKTNESFVLAYKSHFDEIPSEGAALAYDAAKLFTGAVLQALGDENVTTLGKLREAVAEALGDTVYTGVTGKIEYHGTFTPDREHVYMDLSDGKFVFGTRY